MCCLTHLSCAVLSTSLLAHQLARVAGIAGRASMRKLEQMGMGLELTLATQGAGNPKRTIFIKVPPQRIGDMAMSKVLTSLNLSLAAYKSTLVAVTGNERVFKATLRRRIALR